MAHFVESACKTGLHAFSAAILGAVTLKSLAEGNLVSDDERLRFRRGNCDAAVGDHDNSKIIF